MEVGVYLKKARDLNAGFHERIVLYNIVLEQTKSLEISGELQRTWALATDDELFQWAQSKLKNNLRPLHHPAEKEEYIETDIETLLTQAHKKRQKPQAQKDLKVEIEN